MEYSISDASKLLNVSRVTIYKKISRLKDLQRHIIIKSNAKYIDSQGIEIIRRSLIDNQQIKPLTSNEEESIKSFTSVKEEEKPISEDFSKRVNDCKDVYHFEELINNLKQQIDDLKHDKEELYSIIKNEKQSIEGERQLHQNTQILFKEEKERLKLLESKEDKQEQNNDSLKQEIESKNKNIEELNKELIKAQTINEIEFENKNKQIEELKKALNENEVIINEHKKQIQKGFWKRLFNK